MDLSIHKNDTTSVKEGTLLLMLVDQGSTTFWSDNVSTDALSTSPGDSCPMTNTTSLGSAREPFPAMLHVVTTDQVIYACDAANEILVAQLLVTLDEGLV